MPNSQPVQPFAGWPRLLIQHIRSYPPHFDSELYFYDTSENEPVHFSESYNFIFRKA